MFDRIEICHTQENTKNHSPSPLASSNQNVNTKTRHFFSQKKNCRLSQTFPKYSNREKKPALTYLCVQRVNMYWNVLQKKRVELQQNTHLIKRNEPINLKPTLNRNHRETDSSKLGKRVRKREISACAVANYEREENSVKNYFSLTLQQQQKTLL